MSAVKSCRGSELANGDETCGVPGSAILLTWTPIMSASLVDITIFIWRLLDIPYGRGLLSGQKSSHESGLLHVLTLRVWFHCAIAAMVKAEKARNVEDMLINAATSGRLGGKVTEDQFIQMLEQV